MTVIREGVEWSQISTPLSMKVYLMVAIMFISMNLMLVVLTLITDSSSAFTIVTLTMFIMVSSLLIIGYIYMKNMILGLFRFDGDKLIIKPKHAEEINISRELVDSFEPINLPVFDHAHVLRFKLKPDEERLRFFRFDKNSVIPIREWLLGE